MPHRFSHMFVVCCLGERECVSSLFESYFYKNTIAVGAMDPCSGIWGGGIGPYHFLWAFYLVQLSEGCCYMLGTHVFDVLNDKLDPMCTSV